MPRVSNEWKFKTNLQAVLAFEYTIKVKYPDMYVINPFETTHFKNKQSSLIFRLIEN